MMFKPAQNLNFSLTSQHIQNEVHVGGEDLNALHTGNSPNRDKLIAIHLGHQVQILWEVLSGSQKKNQTVKRRPISKFCTKNRCSSCFLPGEIKLELFLQRLSQILRGDRLFFRFWIRWETKMRVSGLVRYIQTHPVCVQQHLNLWPWVALDCTGVTQEPMVPNFQCSTCSATQLWQGFCQGGN